MTPRIDKTTPEYLLEIFGGNPYHARSGVADNGDIYYSPIEVTLTEELIADHLSGKTVLGSYQLLQGSDVVKWLGWDIDSTSREKAREIVMAIIPHLSNIPYAVEFSGGKGYHVLVFLDKPMPASQAKRIVDWVRDQEGFAASGTSHVECFPKQDKLTKGTPKGNLLKIPLGMHPRSHEFSKFIDPLNGWESGPAYEPCSVLSYRASHEDLLAIISEGPDVQTQLVQLVSQYWESGKRHDLSLYLSGFLAHESWGIEQAKELMRQIVQATGDTEEYNRLQTVEMTFAKHKDGKSIRGRQGLGEILPASAMQKLTELVSQLRSPDTVTQIDDIRYTKGRPILDSVRLASNTMWSILNDEGCKIVQTDQNVAYWYNCQDHLLTEEGIEAWRALLNKLFGMNQNDSFSRTVMTELRLRIVREAPIVPIQNRTYWQEDPPRLFINLGGPEVFILDGKTIEKGFNGECGHLFLTSQNMHHILPNFDAPPVDCWDYLTNDLSFTVSTEAPSKPDEQRELFKAWLLAFFFQELMPTKPILAMLGQPGSGKTTAIRRVLRIFEDPDADVLGVPTDKQDSFRASIAAHRLLVLDNLEKSGSYWMVDMLNKLATGNNIELRELYKTNTRHTITPRCFVACTAVNMPFSDETLFSRLLVLEMSQLQEPIAEHVLQRRIREFGPAIWADLLKKLNMVISNLIKYQTVRPPTKSRLADFTVFCERIKNSGVVDGQKLSMGLLSMVDSQLRQLKESSQAVTLLEEWISLKPADSAEWHTVQELFNALQMMAQARRMDFKWKNAVGLARHLNTLQERLEEDFGAQFEEKYNPAQGKDVTRVRFQTMI